MSTTKDIREMSEVEIEKKLRDTHDAHVHLRLRKQTGQVERPHEFTQLRRGTCGTGVCVRASALANPDATPMSASSAPITRNVTAEVLRFPLTREPNNRPR